MKIKIIQIIQVACLGCLLTACEAHFISDDALLKRVEEDFTARQIAVSKADFSAINAAENAYEREALTYLYAYMPLSDLSGHLGQEHLMNIRAARKALKEMKWGSKVPEALVRQYVVPARVYTESLDSTKVLLYKALKPQVKGLTMREAALWVSQWVGQQTVEEMLIDQVRVAAPLTTVRSGAGSAIDRAVLLVAALRTVAIPARLVYTAVESAGASQTDAGTSQSVWAETWCEGQWLPLVPGSTSVADASTLGLTVEGNGWPLVMTHAFGPDLAGVNKGVPASDDSDGSDNPDGEEMLSEALSQRLINITSHYLPAIPTILKVVDAQGDPVPRAKIDLRSLGQGKDRLVAALNTDDSGQFMLTAGQGTLLVWAYSEGRFGYAPLQTGRAHKLTLMLDKHAGDAINETFNLGTAELYPRAASIGGAEGTTVAQDVAGTTGINSTTSTSQPVAAARFMTADQARDFVKLYRLPEEETAVDLIVRSRANHAAITGLMARLRSEKSKKGGFDLLSRLCDEDLRTISLPALLDHMQSTVKTDRPELFYQYVRQPRISDEELSAYKLPLAELFTKQETTAFAAHPADLAAWVAEHIMVDEGCNVGSSPIIPLGAMITKVADSHSRDILFVALARSIGLPARIDRVTGRMQLLSGEDHPTDVNLQPGLDKAHRLTPTRMGWLTISVPASAASNDELAYGRHFVLYQIGPDGRLLRLNFGQSDTLQPFSDWHGLLLGVAALPAGSNYLMLTTAIAPLSAVGGNVSTAAQAHLHSLTIAQRATTRLSLR